MLDPKGRFELRRNFIRARHGHSKKIKVKVEYQEDQEIKTLYHGTSISKLDAILREGIKSMSRVMVHLTSSVQDASR
ncbi:MAG: RNA 2'-phosphotransferase [Candidatus Nezhaarchaeales archaeon]